MNPKHFIAGATVVTSVAMIIAELVREDLEIRREKTDALAHHVSRFAHKESVGEELKKKANLPSKGDTKEDTYEDLAKDEEYRKVMEQKRKNRNTTRKHASLED